ncbi:MAG: hypothetical protein IT376_04915 [Polyangiaceae bacterium]|nr:hypothetical protein [Polyangiaceae bacterium]
MKRVTTVLGWAIACALLAPACSEEEGGAGAAAATGGAGGASGGAAGGAGASGASGGGGDAAASDAPADAPTDGGPGCATFDPAQPTVSCLDVAGGDPEVVAGAVFAVSYVYVDEDRDRQKDPDAWRKLGFDVDGQATDASSANHCAPYGGADVASVKTDGDSGIDNGFVKSLAPVISGLSSGWVESWNRALAQGSGTILVRVPGLDASSGGALPAYGYSSVEACTDWPLPPDGGLDAGGADAAVGEGGTGSRRAVALDRTSVCEGDVERPLWSAPGGTLTGDRWASGVVPEAFVAIPLSDATLVVRLRSVRLEMTLSADRESATLGVLSGVVDVEELVAQLIRIKGALTQLACTIPSLIDGYLETVRRAADILPDGTQDPTKTCAGLTLGLGFDARRVDVRAVAQTPLPADTCDGG